MVANSLKVLTLCGSQRSGSYNQKLLDASSLVLTNLGIVVSTLSISKDTLPVYSHDISVSKATLDTVTDLRSQIGAANGLIVCSPQFNGSIPPYLKNIIDWTAPPHQSEGATNVFKDKVICLLGAARGTSTCLGGLAHLSTVFGFLGSIIVPQYYGVSQAEKAMSDTGGIVDEKIAANLNNYLNSFHSLLKKF